MKKKILLIITFVFGDVYQGYIPIFLYSLHLNYPEYEARIYVDRQIKQKYIDMLELIPEYNIGRYQIKKLSDINGNNNATLNKTYRWLIFENDFLNYRYIYIGDIDIFLCREYEKLHLQHIKHMKAQKTVFSNIIRPNEDVCLPNSIAVLLKKMGLYSFLNQTYKCFFYKKRLSGLHFVLSEQYYSGTKKIRDKYLRVLNKDGVINKIERKRLSLYKTNEQILYNIIKKSKLHLPKQAHDKKNVFECNDVKSNEFRPYHGLHLGVWRENTTIDKTQYDFWNNELNKKFYQQFAVEYKNNGIFKKIIDDNNVTIKKNIERMIFFYSRGKNEN